MIEDATSKGELWTRQWDKVPLDAVFGEATPVNAVVAAAQAAAARLNAGRQRASTWLPPGGLSCILWQSCVVWGASPAECCTTVVPWQHLQGVHCIRPASRALQTICWLVLSIPDQAANTALAPISTVIYGTLTGRQDGSSQPSQQGIQTSPSCCRRCQGEWRLGRAAQLRGSQARSTPHALSVTAALTRAQLRQQEQRQHGQRQRVGQGAQAAQSAQHQQR